MPVSQSGSDVFWAEKQQVVSSFDARDWRAVADATIVVDGKAVGIKAGDNVYAVAAKINDSGAAVKASIDPRSFSLSLETATAHQLRLEDGVASAPGGGPGAVLKELGLLAPSGSPPTTGLRARESPAGRSSTRPYACATRSTAATRSRPAEPPSPASIPASTT